MAWAWTQTWPTWWSKGSKNWKNRANTPPWTEALAPKEYCWSRRGPRPNTTTASGLRIWDNWLKLGPEYAVAVAQSHYGDPTMDAAAAKLAESRGVSSIMCVPYIFFPGIILQRNVIGGLEQIKERYPQIAISVTPPLGVDDKIVAITADRVRQAWSQAAP